MLSAKYQNKKAGSQNNLVVLNNMIHKKNTETA